MQLQSFIIPYAYVMMDVIVIFTLYDKEKINITIKVLSYLYYMTQW